MCLACMPFQLPGLRAGTDLFRTVGSARIPAQYLAMIEQVQREASGKKQSGPGEQAARGGSDTLPETPLSSSSG